DGTAADLIILALEARREYASQFVERRHHASGKGLATSVWELHRLRPVRVLEVVDIDPVCRRRHLRRLGPEMRLDRGRLTRCRRSQHKDVEVVALNAGAELDGPQRPFLTDEAAHRIKLVRGLEPQCCRIDNTAQFRGLERLREGCHRGDPAILARRRAVILCTLKERHSTTWCCGGRDNKHTPWQ